MKHVLTISVDPKFLDILLKKFSSMKFSIQLENTPVVSKSLQFSLNHSNYNSWSIASMVVFTHRSHRLNARNIKKCHKLKFGS